MLVWGGSDDSGPLKTTFTCTPARTFFLYMRP
jgi:hypothetical protein